MQNATHSRSKAIALEELTPDFWGDLEIALQAASWVWEQTDWQVNSRPANIVANSIGKVAISQSGLDFNRLLVMWKSILPGSRSERGWASESFLDRALYFTPL